MTRHRTTSGILLELERDGRRFPIAFASLLSNKIKLSTTFPLTRATDCGQSLINCCTIPGAEVRSDG